MRPKSVTSEAISTLSDAFRRIGTTEKRNARWLLKFIQCDAWKMQDPDLLAVIQNVTAFAFLASGIDPTALAHLKVGSNLRWMTASLDFKDGTGLHYLYPTQDDVKQLQLFTLNAIEELLVQGQTRFPKIAIEMEVQKAAFGIPPLSPRSGGPFFVLPPRADSEEILTAFRFRLAHVLAAVSDRLAKCPMAGRSKGCRIFYLKRQKQLYCSQGCGSAIRMRRRRETILKKHRAKTKKKGKQHGTKK